MPLAQAGFCGPLFTESLVGKQGPDSGPRDLSFSLISHQTATSPTNSRGHYPLSLITSHSLQAAEPDLTVWLTARPSSRTNSQAHSLWLRKAGAVPSKSTGTLLVSNSQQLDFAEGPDFSLPGGGIWEDSEPSSNSKLSGG